MNKTALFALTLSTSLVASNAYAASKTLTHVDRGAFYSPTVVQVFRMTWKIARPERDAQGFLTGNSVDSDSYQVRHIGSGPILNPAASLAANRSYFTFDISGLSAPVTAVKLKVYHPKFTQSAVRPAHSFYGSYQSPDATETVTLYDVNTDAAILDEPDQANSPISKLDRIFKDLGSGEIFGSFVASEASDGTFEVIELNQAGIDALNAAVTAGKTRWSIGASLTTGNLTARGAVERVFRGTGYTGGFAPDLPATPATKLIVEETSTPAPALTGLGGMVLLTGLSGLGLAYRRRKVGEGL